MRSIFPMASLAAPLLLGLLSGTAASAWELRLEDNDSLPPALVVVDKSAHQLMYFEKRSPLTLRQAYPSIHGQSEGDKYTEGDRRTPEGVYFVTRQINGPLDFEEYGSQAHGLNYPNPVDRLRGKTGSGIWIHSKGQPIANQSTRGCIAIDLTDIDRLAPSLKPGTPVLVAENVFSEALPQQSGLIYSDAGTAPALESVVRLLTEKSSAWNQAWADRSQRMFDFYDPKAYSQAQGESFQAFRSNKESLFKRLDWIQILYGDIHVLQGPGYWVTWFEQLYRAPNLSTEGVRRLYWQPGENGELKIVGMEWVPQDLGLERAYLEYMTPGVYAFVEEWRKAWLNADLEAYSACYAINAVQDGRAGRKEISAHKERTWAGKKPSTVDLQGLRVRMSAQGVLVDMTQIYRDSSGYQDRGVKEILLHPEGNSWKIARESWNAS